MKNGTMKVCLMKSVVFLAAMAVATLPLMAATEVVDGITWTYTVIGGNASVGDMSYTPAVSTSTTGGITLPSTLGGYSVTRVGRWAFYNCSELTSITVPDSVTSIGEDAFWGCSSLTRVTMPDGVTSIEKGVFCNCSGLTSVTIPGSVTSIGDYAFSGCSGLTNMTIPDGVTSIGKGGFRDCSGLASVTIPGSVTSIGDYAFSGCSGLTSMTIPGSVTSIGEGVFRDCSGLVSVTILDGVTSIGYSAFSGCSGLTSVTIPGSVTIIREGAFLYCSGLMQIAVSTANDNYSSASGLLLTKDGKSLIAGINGGVVIPDGVASIGEGAFFGCSGLTSVTIPDSVASIGSSAFYGCSGLTRVTIPDSVTSIGEGAFFGCSGLTSVTIPDSVASIGSYAFYRCSSLTNMTIPDGVTSIGYSAFNGCSGLTRVTIPDSVTNIGNSAFCGCSRLASVTIPDSVASIGSSAFYGCSRLASVRISNSMTSIGYCAFENSTLIFDSAPPSIPATVLGSCSFSYPEEYETEWKRLLGERLLHVTVRSEMRENNPAVMDVYYAARKDCVKGGRVRLAVLAFEDGERSFAKVIRPETFVNDTDGNPTAQNVGDNVAVNVGYNLSWKVSEDWATRLAKVKFEVLVNDGALLPMETVVIPASDKHRKIKVLRTGHTADQIFDALMWLYADKAEGLTLENGVLKGNGVNLANGTELSRQNFWSWDFDYRKAAAEFVYRAMGFDGVLSGDLLNYVNEETRLGLEPDGVRQYAYKFIEE